MKIQRTFFRFLLLATMLFAFTARAQDVDTTITVEYAENGVVVYSQGMDILSITTDDDTVNIVGFHREQTWLVVNRFSGKIVFSGNRLPDPAFVDLVLTLADSTLNSQVSPRQLFDCMEQRWELEATIRGFIKTSPADDTTEAAPVDSSVFQEIKNLFTWMKNSFGEAYFLPQKSFSFVSNDTTYEVEVRGTSVEIWAPDFAVISARWHSFSDGPTLESFYQTSQAWYPDVDFNLISPAHIYISEIGRVLDRKQLARRAATELLVIIKALVSNQEIFPERAAVSLVRITKADWQQRQP